MASVIRRSLARTLHDVTPITADDLRRAPILPRLLTDAEPVAAPATCQVLAIASGKGGTGKTVVSTNLAVALAEQGLSVLLLDADLGLANAHLLMGVVPAHDIASVVFGQQKLEDIIVECPSGVKLIAGGSGISELAELKDWQLRRFAGQLRACEAQADIMIVDMPAGIGPQAMRLLRNAHDALIVTTPDVTALMDAYATVKALASGVEALTVKILINRARDEAEAMAAFDKIRTVVARHLPAVQLALTMWLPQNWYVQHSVQMRRPVLLLHPKSFVARAFTGLAAEFASRRRAWAEGGEGGAHPSSFAERIEQLIYE
jgi:flagellar biosynthesis protein FlhG